MSVARASVGLCIVAALMVAVAEARVDPVGTWSCIIYGHPSLGDERVVLRFDPNGDVRLSRMDATGEASRWTPLSGWEVQRKRLLFTDYSTGRAFSADLDYATLGGTWDDARRNGGWWCTPATLRSSGEIDVPSVLPLPPLVAAVTATPWYPRAAVRRAKEGHAVVCFLVGSDGFIRDPEFIELSDEDFRLPSLGALSRSRYAAWNDGVPVRPACRSFEYHLDEVRR
jgi:hypothetical protein